MIDLKPSAVRYVINAVPYNRIIIFPVAVDVIY